MCILFMFTVVVVLYNVHFCSMNIIVSHRPYLVARRGLQNGFTEYIIRGARSDVHRTIYTNHQTIKIYSNIL